MNTVSFDIVYKKYYFRLLIPKLLLCYPSTSLYSFLFYFQFSFLHRTNAPVRFGHVTENDFDISKLNVDTTSGAVILADVGLTTLDGLELVFQEHRRVRIINKNGFDLATVLCLYTLLHFRKKD
ncbi:MAG: hypothetical protein WDM71_00290 [Ferruginibacter sp.]